MKKEKRIAVLNFTNDQFLLHTGRPYSVNVYIERFYLNEPVLFLRSYYNTTWNKIKLTSYSNTKNIIANLLKNYKIDHFCLIFDQHCSYTFKKEISKIINDFHNNQINVFSWDKNEKPISIENNIRLSLEGLYFRERFRVHFNSYHLVFDFRTINLFLIQKQYSKMEINLNSIIRTLINLLMKETKISKNLKNSFYNQYELKPTDQLISKIDLLMTTFFQELPLDKRILNQNTNLIIIKANSTLNKFRKNLSDQQITAFTNSIFEEYPSFQYKHTIKHHIQFISKLLLLKGLLQHYGIKNSIVSRVSFIDGFILNKKTELIKKYKT